MHALHSSLLGPAGEAYGKVVRMIIIIINALFQVCATLKQDNTNVSYGDLSSLRYLNATEEADEYCVVLEMTGGVDTHQPHAIR